MRRVVLLALLLAGCSTLAPSPSATPSPTASPAPTTLAIDPEPGCAGIHLSAEPAVLEDGGAIWINQTLTNCGDAPLNVSPTDYCHQGMQVALQGPSGAFLFDDWSAHPVKPYDANFNEGSHGVCMQAQPAIRFVLPPGENHTDSYRFNGSVQRREWCPISPAGVTYCDAIETIAPGNYSLRAWWGNNLTTAPVRIETAPRKTTRLILVDESDWLNGTDQAPVADLGPHCAPASFADGALTLRTFGEGGLPLIEEWTVLRRYHEDPRPPGVGEGIEARPMAPQGGWLPSPWDATHSVLQVTPLREGDAYLNGTRVASGNATFARDEADVAGGHAVALLDARLVGEVPVSVDRLGPCE